MVLSSKDEVEGLMLSTVLRYSFVFFCTVLLLHALIPVNVYGQSAPVNGTIAGKVFETSSRTAIADVRVSAQLITSNERFHAEITDARGSYLIPDTPPGTYAFSLEYMGTIYPVAERIDARAPMSFLLESCFELDLEEQTASVVPDCESGIYADTQVVSVGPHRFFRPAEAQTKTALVQENLMLQHRTLDCIARSQYPVISTSIHTGEDILSSRVYFRAVEHPDFYYVEMARTGDRYTAVLPNPGPETEHIIYYIEAVDRDFNKTQTLEVEVPVTDAVACVSPEPVPTLNNPNIVVGSVNPEAPPLPPGFDSAGIRASGAFMGTGGGAAAGMMLQDGGTGGSNIGTILIVAGSGAVATVILIEAAKEDEASDVIK